MLLFKKNRDLRQFLQQQKDNGKAIGLVPTMGALHRGHLSLVNASRKDNDLTVCSIFVNPTQFNDPEDLKKYPRPVTADIALLEEHGTELLFWPGVEEVYPNRAQQTMPEVDLEGLDNPMEGLFRPGHFKGVVQVVNRLLDIVQPHRLYMGQKDYQQFAIIRKMLLQVHCKVEIVRAPTVREADGLAMSSRNQRLTPFFRKEATVIFKALQQAKENIQRLPMAMIKANAFQLLEESPLRPEYFEIVDGHSLTQVEAFEDAETIVACIAAWAGDVRLIDNTILKE